MNRTDFEGLLTKLQEAERQISETKGREYAQGEEDALLNFKCAADFLGITPLQVCMVYLYKHFAAIASFVEQGYVRSESLSGRIVDLRLYSALLYGLYKEEEKDETV